MVLLFSHLLYQYIEKRNEQKEHQITLGKVLFNEVYRYNSQNQFLYGKWFISREQKNQIYNNIIEKYFSQELDELSGSDMRLTHKIARYQHKAINPGFPHAPAIKRNNERHDKEFE